MLGSKLGWILSGRTSENVSNITETGMLILPYGTEIQRESPMLTCADKSLPLKPNMEDFWNIETIGISDSPMELNDNLALPGSMNLSGMKMWTIHKSIAVERCKTRLAREPCYSP